MKQLQNNFTTPEQSKRLLELGVPADSADCYYGLYKDLNVRRLSQLESNFFYRGDGICDTFLPCWSVGRLIEIYIIARGVDTSYLLVEKDEDLIKYLIRLYREKINDLDFSKLEE